MARAARLFIRRTAAVINLFLGTVNTASALTPSLAARRASLAHLVPLAWSGSSRLLTVTTGFLFLVTAPGLARGKRTAWAITLALAIVSGFLHLIKGLDYEEAGLMVAAGVFLFFAQDSFRARSDGPSARTGLAILAAAVLFNLAYAAAGLLLLRHQIHLPPTSRAVLLEAWRLAVFAASPELVARGRHARWFLDTVYAANLSSLLAGAWMLLRPVIYRAGATPEERQRAQRIAQTWGRSSLVFFTLWPDKLYFFSRDGSVYIAYRQVGDVAVALGDPVGPPTKAPEAVEEFVAFCEENGWQPVFYQVLPDFLEVYRRVGLQVIKIGEEAVVDLASFSLAGKARKELRYSVNKASRSGFFVRFYEPPLDDDLLRRLQDVSWDWLKAKGGAEKTFSLGWFDREILRQLEVATVEDVHGKVHAFANFVPMYNLSQASPDLIRYRQDSPTGVVDLLLVQAMDHYRARGYREFNLGLAPLARARPEDAGYFASTAQALLFRYLANLRGLYHFKAKYGPRWEPRYLAYPGGTALPKVALAVVRAGNPQGLKAQLRPLLIRLLPVGGGRLFGVLGGLKPRRKTG
ncbi:MAG: phosphatidylglycerol lysyltransferase domain-containing protein [Moorellales bacterium]